MFLSIFILYGSVYSCDLTPISGLRYLISAPVFSEKSYATHFILNVLWGDLHSHIFCSCYRVLYCLRKDYGGTFFQHWIKLHRKFAKVSNLFVIVLQGIFHSI